MTTDLAIFKIKINFLQHLPIDKIHNMHINISTHKIKKCYVHSQQTEMIYYYLYCNLDYTQRT